MVPTVNKGLKAGVVVPMPTIPANVDVAVVLVAVKKDERTLSPNSPVEEALKFWVTRTSRGVLDGVSWLLAFTIQSKKEERADLIQVPEIAKQPPRALMPLENVDVAVVDVAI